MVSSIRRDDDLGLTLFRHAILVIQLPYPLDRLNPTHHGHVALNYYKAEFISIVLMLVIQLISDNFQALAPTECVFYSATAVGEVQHHK